MPNWKEGDRVRVVTRPVTDEDRKKSRYYEHMAGLTGTIQSVYNAEEISVRVAEEDLGKITAEVQKESTRRMREKFVNNVSDEQRKQLTKEEQEFTPHYVILVRAADLEAAK